MKYAWLTDPHLDFLRPEVVSAFAESLAMEQMEGLLITGDIAEAGSVVATLDQLNLHAPCPIYVVLGNHDYYGSSIAKVREVMKRWSESQEASKWMPEAGVISLTDMTALIGHGGWGDGRVGDFMASSIMLNDYVQIEELAGHTKADLLRELNALGTEAAEYLGTQLEAAIQTHEEVILLTHVPPFFEATWHEGEVVLSEWTPHFACGAVGERLVEIMNEHPTKSLKVLCGHTHGAGRAEILPNLEVLTGGAEYGNPKLQPPVEVN